MRPATRREKAAAAAIDSGAFVAVVAACAGGAMGVTWIWMRLGTDEDPAGSPSDRWIRRVGNGDGSPFQTALKLSMPGLAVAGRNWRSPGYRVVGLRRVDSRTNGPVGLRSAVVAQLYSASAKLVIGRVSKRITRGQDERLEALQPELREIQRRHQGDPQANMKAVQTLYEAHDVNPLAGCWPRIALPLVAHRLLTRGGVPMRDRITRTTVVSER